MGEMLVCFYLIRLNELFIDQLFEDDSNCLFDETSHLFISRKESF